MVDDYKYVEKRLQSKGVQAKLTLENNHIMSINFEK